MGGRHKKKARSLKRDFKEPRQDTWAVERRVPKADGTGYEAAPPENQAFEDYYQYQKIVPEGQWDDFMAALRTPLPTTFRINGTGKFAADLRDRFESDFCSKLKMAPTEVEGEPLVPPKPIAWYPNKLAWQLRYSRTQLRKLDALSEIHELLKRENNSGGITRQEAVSMAPPLFLDVKPDHRILDTCAAPGSKTAQMLEMLHSDTELPQGFVVANDVDSQRCNLLVHQTKRMNSPALLVTNHDATGFPLITKPGRPKSEALFFDRILCDVPCSGDGTLRKAPDLWRRWTAAMGVGIHPLQVRITLHTASLLKVGGRMVYSTCSFNPLEDEAVVAEVLRQGQGALELVDVSHVLPNFKRQKGLRSWSVRSNKGSWFTNLQEASDAKHAHNLSDSMFPDETSDAMPLDRCMRVLPHQDDTGGFFIAVLQKNDNLPALQPRRWKRLKELWQETKRAHAIALREGANPDQPQAGQTQNGTVEDAHTSDKPQNSADAAVGKATPGASQKSKAPPQGQHAGQQHHQSGQTDKAFNDGMVEGADDAADAAVVFADAMIDQDTGEAMDAAEDAADAVEHVADMAEDDDRPASQSSVGDVPIPKRGGEDKGGGQGNDEVDGPAKDAEPTEKKQPASGRPAQEGGAPANKRAKKHKPGDEPLALFTDKQTLDALESFFGLGPAFPLRTQTVTRTAFEDQIGARKIYMVSSGIREAILSDSARSLKVTSAGLKVFDKNEKKDSRAGHCAYRISQDGLPVILPHITKQLLRVTATEMLRILKERYVVVPISQSIKSAEEAASPQEPPSKKHKSGETESAEPQKDQAELPPAKQGDIEPKGEGIKLPLSDLQTISNLEHIRAGCTICLLRDEEAQQLGLNCASGLPGEGPMAIVCWRGRTSLSLLVDKNTSAVLAEVLENAIQSFAAQHAPPQ